MAEPRLYDDAPRLPDTEPLDPRALFDRESGPIEVEIGPGRGWFLVERLEADTSLCMIGLEIRKKWAVIVGRRLADRGLDRRGRVYAEDARVAFARFTAGSVRAVFVHFPDPWWKKRHHKRLVVTAPMVAEIARVLEVGGELFVQTDVEERADEYEAVIGEEARLAPFAGRTPRVEDSPYDARSPRERRVTGDGLPVFRLRYRRLSDGEP